MTKKTISIFFFIILFGWTFPEPGKWCVRLIILDGDTIFVRDDPAYSIRSSLKKNQSNIKSPKDSFDIITSAEETYKKTSNWNMWFQNDSDFLTPKVRSGHGIYPNETDTGTYRVSGDTLFMNNRTRRKKAIFIMDAKRHCIYER